MNVALVPDFGKGRLSKPVKCVVWDLDGTIWRGALIEADALELRPGIADVIEALDQRGILNSIASRNDRQVAARQLRKLALDRYFLHPQIGWGAKSDAVRRIAEALHVAVDSIVFVDDEAFEREEVMAALPEVRTVDAKHANSLIELLQLTDLPSTSESRARRQLY